MKIDRRVFLAGLGSVGVGVGLGRFSHVFPLASPAVGPEWSPETEERIASTCLLCPSHCGIVGRVVDGSLVGVEGNPLHPVSRGGLCPKGRAGSQLLYHPGRLRGPLQRTGAPGSGDFEPVEWEQALDRVAGALGTLRSDGRGGSAAWLAGDVGGALGELVGRFLGVLGSPHLIREDYPDGSEEVMSLAQGVASPPAFDLDRADVVLSFGAPLAEAWRCLPQAAQARAHSAEQRRRWIQVDTRLSRTAVAADQFLPVRLGTYGTLALVIAYVMLKEGLYDADWVRRHITGFDDWTDRDGRTVAGYRSLALRHGRPDDLAERIGLPVEERVRVAKEFGRARRPVAVWDHAVSWRRGGLSDALAIHALNILAGSLQRPGGVFLQPALPWPTLEQLSPAGGQPSATGEALREADWADRVLAADRPPIEVLFLHQANPVASSPDPDKAGRALERIPLVVSFSPFLDESARRAHLVLPDHTYLERWQDAPAPSTVPYPVWGVVQPVVPPLHDTRGTGDVILDLASRIGGEVAEALPWSSMESLVGQRATALAETRRGGIFAPAFRREELGELERRGWWIAHGETPGAFWKKLKEAGGWFDPYHDDHGRTASSRLLDGRAALFPEQARRRIAGGLPGLEEGFLPLPADPETAREPEGEDLSDGYPLELVPYRVLTLASGGTPQMPWLLENLSPLTGTGWDPWVEVNPETARGLGLHSGQKVRVVSERGSFTARLRLFAGARPGAVNAPYGLHAPVEGWGRLEPANPLAAVGERRDPITGLPDWYTTRVRIEAA